MNRVSLGSRIREERVKKCLTQAELAEEIDVSTSYMGLIERGERSVTLEKLLDISNVLGVSIDYLLTESFETEVFSDKEKLLVSVFSQATEEQKDLIIEMAKLIIRHKDKSL